VVAITPIARRILYQAAVASGQLLHATELVFDRVFANPDITAATKESMAEMYILNQMGMYGFRAKATAADGSHFDINVPPMTVLLFPGADVPPTSTFDASKFTLFRPMKDTGYANVDAFLWLPKTATLVPIQVTVGSLGDHIAKCRFRESQAENWLKYCGAVVRGANLPRASSPKNSRQPTKRKKSDAKPCSGVIWITSKRDVTINSQFCRELCVDFSELAKEPPFRLLHHFADRQSRM
jgi:hypothetical protein